MGQYKNEWGKISQTMEEHINLMMGRYLETGSVFKCISAKIGFFPYAQCLGKVLMDKDWNRLNNLIYQENCFRSDMLSVWGVESTPKERSRIK